MSFERALIKSQGREGSKIKDLFDLDTDDQVNQVARNIREKSKPKNKHAAKKDLDKIVYIKDGLDEYKSKLYRDTNKNVPIGTTKTAKELLGQYKIVDEIPLPVIYEDPYGNIWRIR